MPERYAHYLAPFRDCRPLDARLLAVLVSLPAEVQSDFLSDTTFRITLEDYEPGRGWRMFMDCPDSGRKISRCVVLRGKLATAPEAFAHYVIAHELAHAYLRNGGWEEISDPEEAADALAAQWGHARPGFRWA